MKIVEGGLPEDKAWRVLVLLSPGEQLGISWQLGLTLIRANNGELVAAIIAPGSNQEYISQARETLSQARKRCRPEDPVYTAIVDHKVYRKAASQLVEEADIDLLITSSNTPGWKSLDRLPCALAVVRGEGYNPLFEGPEAEESASGQRPIRSILVPTSGGPNSAHALGLLLPLAQNKVDVRALYVAPSRLGSNEEALGRSRLRQTLTFIDAGDHIDSKLVSADSVSEGILDEANDDYDIVIIGATRESQLDKALFGNIPDLVVSQCHKPVVIVREPSGHLVTLTRQASWAIQPIRLNLRDRTAAYVRIRRDARPSMDFYVLTGLSAAIAALGLLANSAAVVIGAMLVAPLMSPIAGTGLAMVQGDTRFLRLAFGAALRGALLALFMGLLVGFLPIDDPMTSEVLARTQPSMLDVGVALLSGMAVAYALCRSEATAALPGVAIAAALVPPLSAAGISLAKGFYIEFGGALLLYVTNFIAIASAAALVFIILGFRPSVAKKDRQAVRSTSARIALVGLIIVVAAVGYTTYRLGQESAYQLRIQELANQGVEEIVGARLDSVEFGDRDAEILQLDITVRSPVEIQHSRVVDLQEFIATELQRDVAISLTVIRTTELDPFSPPTLTPTPTASATLIMTSTAEPTRTMTPSPSHTPLPTASETPIPTETATPTVTASPTFTPSPSATPTATRISAAVDYAYGLNLREEPSSDSALLRLLEDGTTVIILEGIVENGDGTWQQIEVGELTGWVLANYLSGATSFD